ncbi:MAG: DegV family protein [Cellulosilyticum sp.]|nr:DegV family protein [Cellulosilyticum sp.]
MSEIVLLSDSSCDLPASCLEKYHVELIPYYVSFDSEHYYKEIVELSIADFYNRLRSEKIFPKTSLPSINDYYEHFRPHIEAGKSVICVTLSSHFSGSHNAALNARELILENYPNAQIEIINSLNATGGEGVLVLEIGRMIQAGVDFDTIIQTIPKLRDTARIFFFVETLDYLEHGGRIGKASALLGTMLNVKPIIYLQDGLLFPNGKVRGTKKALAKILDIAKDYVGDDVNDYHYLVAHADNIEYAEVIKDGLKAQLNVPVMEDFCFIGTTIGVYTGPDVVGICLIKKYETLI